MLSCIWARVKGFSPLTENICTLADLFFLIECAANYISFAIIQFIEDIACIISLLNYAKERHCPSIWTFADLIPTFLYDLRKVAISIAPLAELFVRLSYISFTIWSFIFRMRKYHLGVMKAGLWIVDIFGKSMLYYPISIKLFIFCLLFKCSLPFFLFSFF